MKHDNLIGYYAAGSIIGLIVFSTFIFCIRSMDVKMYSGYIKKKYIVPDHYINTEDHGRVHVAQEFVLVLTRGDKQKAFVVKESIYNEAKLYTMIAP